MAGKKVKELLRVPPEDHWRLPFEEMEQRFEDMENWMEGLFGSPFRRPLRKHAGFRFPRFRQCSPTVDVYEDKNDVVIKAEMAGMEKGDLDIKISGKVLTLAGEKKSEEKVEEGDYYFHERSTGSFRRQIPLPEGTESDKAKATFKDGVLEIRIPKSPEAREKVKSVPIL